MELDQRSIKGDIFYNRCYCVTSGVHEQLENICIQGYLRILWIRNTKPSKIDKIHKFYFFMLKVISVGQLS